MGRAGGAYGRRGGAASRSRHLSLVSPVVSSAPRRRFCCHQIRCAPPLCRPNRIVTLGLDPRVHGGGSEGWPPWMPGSSPGMTDGTGRRGVWPAGWRRKSQPAPVSCLARCQFCPASPVLLPSNPLRATALSPQPDCHPRARPEGPWWRQRGVAAMDARVKPGHDRWDGPAARMAGGAYGRRGGAVSRSRLLSLVSPVVSSAPRHEFCCHQICSAPPALSPNRIVTLGLDPRVHGGGGEGWLPWMPGSSPGMTEGTGWRRASSAARMAGGVAP